MDINYVLVNEEGKRYIEVPVNKRTKQYFSTIFNTKDGFLYCRLDDALGTAVDLLTERDVYRKITLRRKSQQTKLKLLLPKKLNCGKVKEEQLEKLGKLFDQVFKDQFLSYVKGAVQTGCSDNFAVIQFLEKHKITEDAYSVDTAKKAWRDAKNAKTFSLVLS